VCSGSTLAKDVGAIAFHDAAYALERLLDTQKDSNKWIAEDEDAVEGEALPPLLERNAFVLEANPPTSRPMWRDFLEHTRLPTAGTTHYLAAYPIVSQARTPCRDCADLTRPPPHTPELADATEDQARALGPGRLARGGRRRGNRRVGSPPDERTKSPARLAEEEGEARMSSDSPALLVRALLLQQKGGRCTPH
jgi:hypothetical protein